jgi:dihydroflavonol-4-reductase
MPHNTNYVFEMKILITGGSGYVGSNLLKRLVEGGHDVTALMRPKSYHPLLAGLGFTRFIGDLDNVGSLLKAVQGADVVYHCAAKISFSKYGLQDAYSTNVLGTRNLLDASMVAGVKRFIFTSACATIGISTEPETILDESFTWIPPESWVYAHTKYEAERMVLSKASHGMETIALNPPSVYGQGDHALNTGFAIKQILRNRMPGCPPGGTSYVSINDLVDAHILALDHGKSGERYILMKENLPYSELFNRIAAVLGSRRIDFIVPRILHYPLCYSMSAAETIMRYLGAGELPISSHIMDELFMFKYYNRKKAVHELGWKPKEKLEDAVDEAMRYYEDQKMLGVPK